MHFHLFIHCVCVNFRFNRTAATHSSTDSDSDSEQTAAEQLELDAWDVVRDFASGKITLSEAEEALQEVLGNGYVQSHWLPAFNAVFSCENDHKKAIQAVDALAAIPFGIPSTTLSPSAMPQPSASTALPQLSQLESELMATVQTLHDRHCIFDHDVPTLEDLLDPPAERENADTQEFAGGEKEIVAMVQYEMAVERGEIVETEDVEDDVLGLGDFHSRVEVMGMCRQLERVCMQEAEGTLALDLAKLLRSFHDELQEIELQSSVQMF